MARDRTLHAALALEDDVLELEREPGPEPDRAQGRGETHGCGPLLDEAPRHRLDPGSRERESTPRQEREREEDERRPGRVLAEHR